MINKQHTQIANAFDFYFMSSQYKMREFFLTGLISGRFNLDTIVRTLISPAVCFKTYFIIAC